MPIERYTKTFLDVATAVKRQFGDESGVEITNSDIARWIDDAQRDIIMNNSDINAAMVQINVAQGQSAYPVVANVPSIFAIQSVHYDGEIIEYLNFAKAQQYIMRKDTGSGSPSIWFERSGVINLYPKPSQSITGGLTVFYNKLPTKVTGDTDVLSVPDGYFKAVVDFCLTQAYMLDENAQLAQITDTQYNTGLMQRANRSDENRNTYPTINFLPEDIY